MPIRNPLRIAPLPFLAFNYLFLLHALPFPLLVNKKVFLVLVLLCSWLGSGTKANSNGRLWLWNSRERKTGRIKQKKIIIFTTTHHTHFPTSSLLKIQFLVLIKTLPVTTEDPLRHPCVCNNRGHFRNKRKFFWFAFKVKWKEELKVKWKLNWFYKWKCI